MKERNAHYHLRIERHILFTALITAILATGLILTLTEIGNVQTTQQSAQTAVVYPVASDIADNAIDTTKDGACPVGQGLPPVKCDAAGGYHCDYNAVTKIGACIKQPTSTTGSTTSNTACSPGGAVKPVVCDVKAGYTCENGFCIRKAPGIPTQSSATGGALSGPAATTGSTEGKKPVPGPVCNGTTVLSPTEARKLNGMCPDVDPGVPGKNVCSTFCKASENALPDKCKPNGAYHCTNTNGKCQTTACGNGPAQGYCGPTEGTCCKNPPPPPPPPPAPPPAPAAPAGGGAAARPAAPRTAVKPRAVPVRAPVRRPAAAPARPAPAPARAGDAICAGKAAGASCGVNKTCRSFGSGGINARGLYCQVGAVPKPPASNPNTGTTVTGALPAGAACRNGTECISKNCAPSGGGWACK